MLNDSPGIAQPVVEEEAGMVVRGLAANPCSRTLGPAALLPPLSRVASSSSIPSSLPWASKGRMLLRPCHLLALS